MNRDERRFKAKTAANVLLGPRIPGLPHPVMDIAEGVLGFGGKDKPELPAPPEAPPPPEEVAEVTPMADPEDEQLKKRRRRAAAKTAQSGAASTFLSDASRETLGGS